MGISSGFFNRFGNQRVVGTDLEIDLLDGTLSVDEVNNRVGVGETAPGTKLQVTDSAPYVTLKNSTAENSEGGCEARVIFEDHADATLAQIEGSHSGASDDTKGKLILSTHTGSSLTTALTIDDTQATTLAGDLNVGGGDISGPTDGSLTIKADTDLIFKIDSDNDGTETFQFQNGAGTEIAALTEAGSLQIDGDFQVSGNNIVDNGGAAGISFDGSGNTQIDLDCTIAGGDTLLGTAGNTTATTISTVTNTGTTAGKSLTIAAGSTTTGANNINGGDLILSSGSGDGNGTSSMQFKTKVDGTDAAAERMRIHTNGFVGIGTAAPTNPLHVSTDTDAEFVALKLGNESDANDTTGKVSLQFDLEDTSGNAVDAAKFLISKEAAFTSTAGTQDAKFELQLSENGTLGTKFTVESDGDITVPGDVNMTDSSAINDENNNKLLKFCSVGSAVNYVEVENAADGTAPAISVLGDSTNITMSLKPKGTGGVRIFGSTTAAASLLLNEDSDNGTNFMKFQAAANIASNHTYTFPDALPGSPKILQSDSSGNLSWEEDLDRDDASLILHMQVFS
jgi:hypothetical protein